MGYLALLTSKNNPLFDVVASKEDGSRSVVIQIKTRSIGNDQGWKLGKEITNAKGNSDLFIVLVNLTENGLPDVYEYDVFAERVSANYQNYLNTPKKRRSAKRSWI